MKKEKIAQKKFEVILETTIRGERVSNSTPFDNEKEANDFAKKLRDGSDFMGLEDDVIFVKQS